MVNLSEQPIDHGEDLAFLWLISANETPGE